MPKWIILLSLIHAVIPIYAQPETDYLAKAEDCIRLRNYSEATAWCDKQLLSGKRMDEACFIKGTANAANGFYMLAAEDLTCCLKHNPDNAEAYALRGFCYFNMLEYKNAQTDYIKACGLDTSNAVYAYNLGTIEQRMHKWTEAINSFTLAIRLRSDYSEAYRDRGFIEMNLQRFAVAIRDFDSALTYNQQQETTFLFRGMCLTGLKRYAEATAMFNRCIRMKDRNAPAYYNRGLVRFKQHDYRSAQADFDTAILYKPDMEIAWFNRGLCKLELNPKRNTDSCEDFRRAAALGYMEALDYLKKYCE